MPFGMKNSQTTFQRLMNFYLRDLEGVAVYVSDIVICSGTWEEHLKILEQILFHLKQANFIVNLSEGSEGCLLRALKEKLKVSLTTPFLKIRKV